MRFNKHREVCCKTEHVRRKKETNTEQTGVVAILHFAILRAERQKKT